MSSRFEILVSTEFRSAVEANIEADTVKLALDKRLANASEVASAIKYLQRARNKLPSYYAARAIIPRLAFEQSSSEDTAAARKYEGSLAIDLTCGLGVDSLYLSKRFERVVAIEADRELADIAQYNFKLLGADNIEVVRARAEDFIENYRTEADFIYCDPDRRGIKGNKLVLLENCSPDVTALMPRLKEIARKVVIKASPMFDIAEPRRLFGERTRVEVVSLHGECKEVLIEVDDSIEQACVKATAIGKGSVEYALERYKVESSSAIDPYFAKYLIVPDVALQKARVAVEHFAERGVYIESDNSFGFATQPVNAIGRRLSIISVDKLNYKKLAAGLKRKSVSSIEIIMRDFPVSAGNILKRLGVSEGNGAKLAFTTIKGIPVFIELGNNP
jgi:hypothetical protein